LIWKDDELWEPGTEQQRQWVVLIDAAYSEYLAERKEGIPPEDARYVLPNATKTEVATTFNLRQWRHVFRERALNKHAQWEIRGIFSGLLEEFQQMMPSVFDDMGEA
jgi:thymidylate synthase (FAD)